MIATMSYDRPREGTVTITVTSSTEGVDTIHFGMATAVVDRAESPEEAIDIDSLFLIKTSGHEADRPRAPRSVPQEDTRQSAQLGSSKPVQLPSGYG